MKLDDASGFSSVGSAFIWLNVRSLACARLSKGTSRSSGIHVDYHAAKFTANARGRKIRDEFSVEPEQDVWDVFSYLAL